MGRVGTDSLFLGLTRSAMIFGVSFMYFGMNIIFSLMYFVITSDFKVVIIAGVLHLFGMVVTKKEPLAIEILITKMQKCSACRNRQYYGRLNSYSVFSSDVR
jgi:type IV secretion system protein VirB3